MNLSLRLSLPRLLVFSLMRAERKLKLKLSRPASRDLHLRWIFSSHLRPNVPDLAWDLYGLGLVVSGLWFLGMKVSVASVRRWKCKCGIRRRLWAYFPDFSSRPRLEKLGKYKNIKKVQEYVPGNPPSVFRSQSRTFCVSLLVALSLPISWGTYVSSTVKSPPVAGIKAISPIWVLNVESSSCANWIGQLGGSLMRVGGNRR